MPYNDFFTDIKANLENFASSLQNITTAIAVISLVAAAIMFFFGGEAVRAAKRQLLWALVGIGLAAAAFSIVSAVSTAFQF